MQNSNPNSQKLAVSCLKQSNKEFSFNERVIYIDTDEIRYYSKPPKDFSKNEFAKLNMLPKMGVPVALVELAYPSEEWTKKKNKKNAIRVVFEDSCRLTYVGPPLKRINKQGTVVDLYEHISSYKGINTKNKAEWIFVFRTPQDLHTFIQIVENKNQPDASQRQTTKDTTQTLPDELENRNLQYLRRMGLLEVGPLDDEQSDRNGTQTPANNQYILDEKLTEDEERARKVQLIKDKVFQQKQREEDALLEEKRKSEKEFEEQQRAQMDMKDRMQYAWKINFQQLIKSAGEVTLNNNPEQIIKNAMQLANLISEFKKNAMSRARDLINELIFPINVRNFRPIHITEAVGTTDPNIPTSLKFQDDNYMFVLNICEEIEKVSLLEKQLDPFVIEENSKKESELEFLGQETINDAVLELGNRLNMKILAPLAASIYYKGFHVLVMMNMEFQPENLVYGRKESEFYQYSYMAESLARLGRYLNIKQHPIKGKITGDSSSSEIFLSQFLQIYKSDIKTIEDISSKRRDGKVLKKTLTNQGDWSDSFYYVQNAASIFPLDVDISHRSRNTKKYRLRPEFMQSYRLKLNPDPQNESLARNQLEQTDMELTEANKDLNSTNIRLLAHSLDSLEHIPLDSDDITSIFHSFGVNTRYLGKVCERSKLPHVKDILAIEMIARSSRVILDKYMSHLIFNAGLTQDRMKVEGMTGTQLNNFKTLLIRDFEEEVKVLIVKMLNCLLGKSEKSAQFWETSLKAQVYYDFGHLFPKGWTLADASPGTLLFATFHHLNIQMRDRAYTICKDPTPFVLDDLQEIKCRVRTFALKKHKIRQLVKASLSERFKKNYEVMVSLSMLKKELEKVLDREHDYLDAIAEYAEASHLKDDYRGAIESALDALKRVSVYHPVAIKFRAIIMKSFISMGIDSEVTNNYEESIKLIYYNFGVHHPLYANFHSYLASYHLRQGNREQALMFYQKGLNECLRILGADHPLTGQFYVDIAVVMLKNNAIDQMIIYLEKAYAVFNLPQNEKNIEQADFASKIAVVLFDSGNLHDAIEFAKKSNEIYELKADNRFIDKVMDNHLVIAKCQIRVDEDAEALKTAELIYSVVSKNSIWTPSLGSYIVESLKIVYELEMKARSYEQRCIIYYLFDMLHNSFEISKPTKELYFLERLKQKCEDARTLKNFMYETVETVYGQPRVFEVSNLMNISFDKFLKNNPATEIVSAMDKMNLLYHCLGGDFLLFGLKPIIE